MLQKESQQWRRSDLVHGIYLPLQKFEDLYETI